MSGPTTFSSDKESLGDLLSTISKGKTQLPDFQRGWISDDEHIRSLLASCCRQAQAQQEDCACCRWGCSDWRRSRVMSDREFGRIIEPCLSIGKIIS